MTEPEPREPYVIPDPEPAPRDREEPDAGEPITISDVPPTERTVKNIISRNRSIS